MDNKVYDRLKYFSEEQIEEAIEQLENSLKTGIPLNEDDIQWYNTDVIY